MMTNHIKKYYIFSKNAAANLAGSSGQIFGRSAMYFIVILLFCEIFKRVNADNRFLWYVAITQLLIMSTSGIAFEVASDIKSRQVSIFLTKPVDYLLVKLYEALGNIAVKTPLLGTIGFITVLFLTGEVPVLTAKQLLTGFVLSICSLVIYTSICAIIGLLAFWMKDVKCIIYLNMTSTFCFGGLIIPISNYPEAFKQICFLTPYPWILYAPAKQLTFGDINIIIAFIHSLFWIALFLFLLTYIYYKLLQTLMEKGL